MLRGHVGEGGVAEVGWGERLENRPSGGTPQPDARERRGYVLDLD